MTYRLLHLSDVHLDSRMAQMGCSLETARQFRIDLRQALLRAGELARTQNCEAITIAGDLFEGERISPETSDFLVDTFASWQPLPVFISPGGNDPYSPGSPYRTALWSDNVHLFCQPAWTSCRLRDGLYLWGLGHPNPEWQIDPLATVPDLDADAIHVALFCSQTSAPIAPESIRERGFRLGLCGRSHQRLWDAGAGLLFPGSLEPLSPADTGGRGPVVVEIADSGEVTVIPQNNNRWWVQNIGCDILAHEDGEDVAGKATKLIGAALEGHPPGRTFVSLQLTGTRSPKVDLRELEQVARTSLSLAGLRIIDGTTIAGIGTTGARPAGSVQNAFVTGLMVAQDGAATAEKALIAEAIAHGMRALAGQEVVLP